MLFISHLAMGEAGLKFKLLIANINQITKDITFFR